MGDDITIGVTEIVNNIEVTAQPNDQIVDISVVDNTDIVTLNVTPTIIEINVNKGSSYAKWGTITGTLTDQSDLVSTLALKADLVAGKVPSSQLPSYVDDVIEVANFAALPITGETGKIYITIDNNHIFRWTGSTYVEITDNTAVWGAITGTLSSQSDLQSALNAKVPYTGATSNVNLGEYGLTSGYVGFDITPTGTPSGIGTMYWDTANRTVSLIDGDGDTTLQIGQEERILVHNNTGSTLTDGQVVYVTGSTGELPSVSLANASNESTSAATIGVVTEAIANGADGFITTSGLIHGLNTLAFNEGDLLWLGTTSGTYTNVKPTSPNHLVLIGYVIKKAGGNGSILVKIQNTQELKESSDVLFSGLANNDVLVYETASSLWKNKSLATILGYTPANDANVVHKTGDESISGRKTFSSTTDIGIRSNNSGNSYGIYSDNSSTGTGIYVANSGQGVAFGVSNVLNSFGNLFEGSYNGINKFYVNYLGNIFGNSFIKSGGTSSQFLKADGSVDSSTYALTSQLHNAVTIGTANGLSLSTQVLSLGLSSSSTNGALSSTDWTTFNNKQNALTNPITGTGTTNYHAKFTGSGTLGNSIIYDNGTNVGIGTTSPDNGLLTILKNTSRATESSYGLAIQSNASNVYTELLLGADDTVDCGVIQTAAKNTSFTAKKLALQPQGGNVGIGTTSPSALLHLATSSGNGSAMRFESTSTNGRTYGIGSNFVTGVGEFSIYDYTANAERMRIKSTGAVNVSNLGTGLVYSNGGDLTSTNPSDERLKDNITNLQYGLNEILQLRPVSYDWKNDVINQGTQYGFIAQEVQEVMPELVKEFETKDGEENVVRLGLDKEGIYAALVNAIKELKAEINLLKQK